MEVLPTGTLGVSTAYSALMENRADSEGLALAFQLLCQQLKLDCSLVPGSLDGQPHYWNVVALEDGVYRHLDPSRSEGLFFTDTELAALGYLWDQQQSP